MEQTWQAFLVSQGAVTLDHQVSVFPDEGDSGSTGTYLNALSQYGLLKISGADAASFLQSQFTNDVTQINDDTGQLNAYCSPKGRTLALFILFQQGDNFFLSLPADVLPSLLKRLKMFVLMSKVEIENCSDTTVSFGLTGSDCKRLLENAGVGVPSDDYAVKHSEGLSVIKLTAPDNTRRYQLLGSAAALIPMWERLLPNCQKVTSNRWELDNILTGIPAVTTDIVDAYIPQMLNLDLINGLSFTKGCYPGQETVARTRYLGKQKRRTYLLTFDSAAVAAGTKVMDEDDNTAGQIISVALWGQNQYCALAVLNSDAVEEGGLTIDNDKKSSVSQLAMPYEIPGK